MANHRRKYRNQKPSKDVVDNADWPVVGFGDHPREGAEGAQEQSSSSLVNTVIILGSLVVVLAVVLYAGLGRHNAGIGPSRTSTQTEAQPPNPDEIQRALDLVRADLKNHPEWSPKEFRDRLSTAATKTAGVPYEQMDPHFREQVENSRRTWLEAQYPEIVATQKWSWVGLGVAIAATLLALASIALTVCAGQAVKASKSKFQEQMNRLPTQEMIKSLNEYYTRREHFLDLQDRVTQIEDSRTPNRPGAAYPGHDRRTTPVADPAPGRPPDETDIWQKPSIPDFSRFRSLDKLDNLSELRRTIELIPPKLIPSSSDRDRITRFLALSDQYAADRANFPYVRDLTDWAKTAELFRPVPRYQRELAELVAILKLIQKAVLRDLEENGPPTVDNVKVDDIGNLHRFKTLVENSCHQKHRDGALRLISLAERIASNSADTKEEGREINLLLLQPLFEQPESSLTKDETKVLGLCQVLREAAKRELQIRTSWRIITPAEGQAFDSLLHKASGEAVATNDRACDGKFIIARCNTPGLTFKGAVSSGFAAEVSLFRYTPEEVEPV